jgi:hypothetical protein
MMPARENSITSPLEIVQSMIGSPHCGDGAITAAAPVAG